MLVDAGAYVDLNLAVCLGDVDRVRSLLDNDSLAINHAPFPNDLVLDAVLALGLRITDELPCDDFQNVEANRQAMQRNDQILRMLLERGAPIDTPDFGWSPLFNSCQMNHPYVTELLLQHGANPNVENRGRDLMWVVGCSACPEQMLQVLKRYGFKPHES